MNTTIKRLSVIKQQNASVIRNTTSKLIKRFSSTIKVKERDDPADEPSNTTLIFNLDGTILNTSKVLKIALETLLQEHRITLREDLLEKGLSGGSFKSILKHTFNSQKEEKFKSIHFLEGETLRLAEIFNEKQSETPVTLFDEPSEVLHDTLKDLVEQGHRLVIVSNLPQKIADRLVDKFLLRRYFALVVGGDLLPVCKPDPGHLLYAVECSGGDIAGALLIADSLSDIKAAKSASIPVIAFPRDQKTKLLMDKFHPEMFIDAIHEIPDAMEQLMENSMY